MAATDLAGVLQNIRAHAAVDNIRITQHGHQEMVQEDIILDEVLQVIAGGKVLEDYPDHRRGACCLLSGVTSRGRPLQIVCTAAQPVLILITVYEPRPPKWVTSTERGL